MYRVFISYRRDPSAESAVRLQECLIKAGIPADQVFLDKHSINHGSFPDYVKEAIESAENFVVLLDQECLKKKEKGEDYFYDELEQAIKIPSVNIIPMFYRSFKWPENPDAIAQLVLRKNGVEDVSVDYYDVAVEKLIGLFKDEKYRTLLLRKMKNQNLSIVKNRKLIETQTLDERWQDAKEVRICAYCSFGLLTAFHEPIDHLLSRGGKMKFIMNDPRCPAAQDAIHFKCGKSQGQHLLNQMFENSYYACLDWKEKYPDQFEFKLTDMYLTCAIQDVIGKVPEESSIKIDLYGIGVEPTDRRSFIIPFDDGNDNYAHFHEQFERMWNDPTLTYGEPKGEKR